MTNKLRIVLYPTLSGGTAGFVEETRRGGYLLGFVSAPDMFTAALQAARLVATS